MQGRNTDADIENRLWTQWGKERVPHIEKVALKHTYSYVEWMGFPGGASGKESTHQCRRLKIPGSGRSPAVRNSTHSRILTWEVSWAEEPGRL